MGSVGCMILMFLIWIALNAVDGIWLYFYVMACVDPNPRTPVNKTHSGFEGYEAMMFLFGFVWGLANLGVGWGYFAWLLDSDRISKSPWVVTLKVLFNCLLMVPLFAFLIIMPFFGGWIVVPIAQTAAWNHRCDSYLMYAVLDGKGFKDARYTPNVAHFYLSGSSSSLYTFDISNGGDTDFWSFHMRTWDVDQATIPVDVYPTLQSLQYNFINDTVTGNCTTPAAEGSSIVNSTACMQGTFNPNNYLSFNLTSAIPLNTTFITNITSVPSTTTQLRIVDKEWAFGDDAPSLILRMVDPLSNVLQQTVMRTAVTKRGDCTQLKVCLAGVDSRPGAVVGAEVMAPLGLILMRQADYATECTTPSDDGA